MIDRSIRHVALVLMACFVLLFVQLNRVQVFGAEALRENPNNTRTIQRDFGRSRGSIFTTDGEVVARSDEVDGPFERLRVYPHDDLYAHTVGYLSFNIGAEGIERSFNDELVGRTPGLQLSGISDLLANTLPTGNLVLTLDHELQLAARDALGDRPGSIVALDPSTGAVRAMWSWPSFDPNLLSSHDGVAVNASFSELINAEGNPLRASSFRDVFFPGSTFKIVTASAGLESGAATMSNPVFPVTNDYTPPLTSRPIANFANSACGGDLDEMIRVSCNGGFARLAAELIGPSSMIDEAQGFGFNLVPPFDVPGAVASSFPTDYGTEVRPPSVELPAGVFENTPLLAQAAIGQNEVAATPLQMALVAAAIANDGQVMQPYVVQEVRNVRGDAVSTPNPRAWLNPLSSTNANDLRAAMINSAVNGTGNRALVPGLEIGTKTGTAQLGTETPRSHAWTIAFAGPPGADPELVIAVLVEADPENPDQTGGQVAAPIVAELIATYFAS
ncbi:MAG: peptidoglycan D,D-transpeptidase FtsI family protein [Ilumatobacter sp.]